MFPGARNTVFAPFGAEKSNSSTFPADVVNSTADHCELDLVNRYTANNSAKFFDVGALVALCCTMFMEDFSNLGMSLFLRPRHWCRPRRVCKIGVCITVKQELDQLLATEPGCPTERG